MQENYVYYSAGEQQEKKVEIAAFSQPIHDSNTACIAVLDGNKFSEQETKSLVSSHLSLGSPIVLICRNDILHFWHFNGPNAIFNEKTKINKLDKFFAKYKTTFSPGNLHRAKIIGQKNRPYQWFMFVVEKKEGEYLSNLMVKVLADLKKGLKSSVEGKWLFQAGFWLIGAKILKDKKVSRFQRLDISDINELISKVQEHYSTDEPLDIYNKSQKNALERVAEKIVKPTPSLAHITTESLAYVYENTLVSKKTRQALGTHATPSWLVNYIVWQLVDWIEAIPQENRIILEPACGHAPFLTAGAKLLSDPLVYRGNEEDRHKYLKEHLVGIDKDSFAEEIARLTLTLGDIPNPNGWDIRHLDIYENDILKKAAQKATILFCNPPFENFSQEDKQIYGDAITTGNKASEVLAKTLPYMPANSVFGIILPQGFLHKKNLANLREYILDDFELRTICVLPENGVFGQSKHPAAVLLGRKVKSKKNISYVRIPKSHLETFKNTYHARETSHSKNEFYMAEYINFRISELKEIWNYCEGYAKFQDVAEIGRGIEYKNFKNSVKKEKFEGAVKGFGRFEKRIDGKKIDITITSLPDCSWLSLEQDGIQNPRSGTKIGLPQVLANRQRSGANIWRIKGLIDFSGCPSTDSFLVIRPHQQFLSSLYAIFALINSPYTSAYMFDNCMERNNLEGTLREMPIPFKGQDLSKLEALAKKYFEFDRAEFTLKDEEKFKQNKKQCLLEIDAEVLRLYDLPPRLEKMLLDFFEGVQRKGVDFKFDRYFPKGFESWIPLHEYLSEEYQRSTPSFVNEWVEKNRSPEVIRALKAAVEAFED